MLVPGSGASSKNFFALLSSDGAMALGSDSPPDDRSRRLDSYRGVVGRSSGERQQLHVIFSLWNVHGRRESAEPGLVVRVSVFAVATSWHPRRLSSRQSAMVRGLNDCAAAPPLGNILSRCKRPQMRGVAGAPPTPYLQVFICCPSAESIRAATTSVSAAALRCVWRRTRRLRCHHGSF